MLYANLREVILNKLEGLEPKPVYLSGLVGTLGNFRMFQVYVHKWHDKRIRVEVL